MVLRVCRDLEHSVFIHVQKIHTQTCLLTNGAATIQETAVSGRISANALMCTPKEGQLRPAKPLCENWNMLKPMCFWLSSRYACIKSVEEGANWPYLVCLSAEPRSLLNDWFLAYLHLYVSVSLCQSSEIVLSESPYVDDWRDLQLHQVHHGTSWDVGAWLPLWWPCRPPCHICESHCHFTDWRMYQQSEQCP